MALNWQKSRDVYQINARFNPVDFVVQKPQNAFPSVLSEERSGAGRMQCTDPTAQVTLVASLRHTRTYFYCQCWRYINYLCTQNAVEMFGLFVFLDDDYVFFYSFNAEMFYVVFSLVFF